MVLEELRCVTLGLLNKECVIFYLLQSSRKIGELFFHESICKIKMNTGGKLIWTAGCQMLITRSVGSGKAGPGTGFTDNVFNVLSYVVTGQLSH